MSDKLPTMKEIRKWANRLIPDSNTRRAEIIINEVFRAGAMPDHYTLNYNFDPIGDSVLWFETCLLDIHDLKVICAKLMKMEDGNGCQDDDKRCD